LLDQCGLLKSGASFAFGGPGAVWELSKMPALCVPRLDPIASMPIITCTLRDWQKAFKAGVPSMPHLFARLRNPASALLAPVLDSLFRFYQAALKRPLLVGHGASLSEDEALLLALVSQPDLCSARLDCSDDIARGFNCALCSARIMLAFSLEPSLEDFRSR
jgi:hypothetical protein